jgi:hypothetical protein
MTRRKRPGIPGLREMQAEAAATRREHERQGGDMAGAATTKGNRILDNGDVVNADGEIIERGTPEPTEAEQSAAEIANRDAASDEEMAEMLDRNIVGWRPSPGDKIVGTVTARYELPGFQEDSEPYVVLETITASGTEIAVHCFHTALRSQVIRYDPQPGDRIGVTYKGFRGHEQGYEGKFKGYEDYRLIVRRKPADGSLMPVGNGEASS